MGYLPDPKARTIFVTASTITLNGKCRKIVIECRPEFAIVQLQGTQPRYPLAWETIYEAAERHYAMNLRLEGQSERQRKKSSRSSRKA
jgi:hypothetical protein